MIKVIKGKQIIIIGIISLLATGIILSSNWNYFIQNNDNNNHLVSSYQLNTNENIYTKYSQEESSIMFQINVLNSAISRNNIMYQQYNNVFKHNINYVRIQRNTIRNRINVANSSIKHEIDILNNMKNIVYNHPYNYLKFFQSKNYTLPQIVSQKQINHSYSLNNIKTYTQNINNSNTSVKNISYQSEEATIGIGAITSITSASKTLIFSKVHFNYGSVYYFSSNLNNLSTNYQAKVNISLTNIQPTAVSQNKFINYKKTNNTNLSNVNPVKVTSDLFNIYHFMKRNQLALILGFVGGTITVTALGALAVGGWRISKKYSGNVERVNLLINNAFEAGGVQRPMSLTSFNKQIVRHAISVEMPTLPKATQDNIKASLLLYITYKKNTSASVFDQQTFDDIINCMNITDVNHNLFDLKNGEKTTSNGWYKMPVFEQNEYNNLSDVQKTEINGDIDWFSSLISRLPSKSDEGAIIDIAGRDIAIDIFNDLREVASAHLEHLQTLINTAATPVDESENTIVQIAYTIPDERSNVSNFLRTTRLRKEDPTDISHIPNIENLLQNLEDIAEYGTP